MRISSHATPPSYGIPAFFGSPDLTECVWPLDPRVPDPGFCNLPSVSDLHDWLVDTPFYGVGLGTVPHTYLAFKLETETPLRAGNGGLWQPDPGWRMEAD